jgi:uncharacterized protein with PIN domain
MPKRKTQEEFIKEVKERYGDEYTVLGQYIYTHTPIKLKHNVCGNIWDTTAPYDFLKPKANTCPKCSHPSRPLGLEGFKEKVKKLEGDKYTVLGDIYINNKTAILMRHNICGTQWNIRPDLFNNGHRCPECAKNITESRGMKRIKENLNKIGLYYEEEKIFPDLINESYLRIDLYLPEYNIAIEFDGEHHFKPKRGGEEEYNKTKIRDEIKNTYCKEKNIPLLRIPYWNEKNIKNILYEFLLKNNVIYFEE